MRRQRQQQVVDPIPFTKDGLEKLKTEQAKLLIIRKDALVHLQKARELGDLRENGYYKSYRAKLSSIDHRLGQLKYLLRYGQVTEDMGAEIVSVGSTVTISDGKHTKTFQLVGAFEADPSNNKLSTVSPIGKALMGRKVGEQAVMHAPSGTVRYIVMSVQALS